jgi:predicted Rossmann fold nucleotide-binding protein DprA/Smf involved in DNA uptake
MDFSSAHVGLKSPSHDNGSLAFGNSWLDARVFYGLWVEAEWRDLHQAWTSSFQWITSDFEKGGTWTGAIEQLEKLHFVPIFVRNGSNAGKGNSALLQHGAGPWPNPSDKSELSEALSAAAEAIAAEPKQETLTFFRREEVPPLEIPKVQEPPKITDQAITKSPVGSTQPKDEVSPALLDILYRELGEPLKESKVAEMLGIKKPEAKALLTQLVKEGLLEKRSKPVRYTLAKREDRLL